MGNSSQTVYPGHEARMSFPLTLVGKIEYERAFERLSRNWEVREIPQSHCYMLAYKRMGNSNAPNGITVIK